jgi:soluble lytic murein transglycosylase-like protein
MKTMVYSTVILFTTYLVAAWTMQPTTVIEHEIPLKESFKDTLTTLYINQASPPCLQMYYAIEKYAPEYGIPLDYAYGIAYYETRYQGPFHWEYDQAKGSSAGAVGPMQIMPQYAHPYVDGPFTVNELKNNIEMNVKASMRMLQRLKKLHGDWHLVFGAYNTGRPLINDYARNVYNYKPKFKLNGKSI